jgi:hypothetical protein
LKNHKYTYLFWWACTDFFFTELNELLASLMNSACLA